MKDINDVIKTLIVTEKISNLAGEGKYAFEVDLAANKIEIKKAVETIYKVKVKDVNTMIMPGKSKRVRYQVGYTSKWKKALVTLKEGQKIDIAH